MKDLIKDSMNSMIGITFHLSSLINHTKCVVKVHNPLQSLNSLLTRELVQGTKSNHDNSVQCAPSILECSQCTLLACC